MSIACKFCAGDLTPESGKNVCMCEFCGTKQTVPTDSDEKKSNLLNRANRLRMGREYDRAQAVYSSAKASFPDEAEAFWGICLCLYGVEYIKDPGSEEFKTICRRIMPVSILENEFFIHIMETTEGEVRQIYQKEAGIIDQIQKEYLTVASAQIPCDVFICCREMAAEDGCRSEESAIAGEILTALTEKGLKVFFARESLADKPEPYVPYIYSALSHARIMLVVGTCPEAFDDIESKGEWNQFLTMRKTDRQKRLLLCTRDIDEYDIPSELSRFEVQNMDGHGWLQELTEKVCG